MAPSSLRGHWTFQFTSPLHNCDGLFYSLNRIAVQDGPFSWQAPQEHLDTVREWIESYLVGNPQPMNVNVSNLSAFQTKVLKCIQEVPFGHTISYGEVAECIGKKGAARAVGRACHLNPYPLLIPCHRVISANGNLGGYAYGLAIKKPLLDFEKKFKKF